MAMTLGHARAGVILPVLMLLVTSACSSHCWALASNALSDSVAASGGVIARRGWDHAGARDVALQEIGASQAAWCCARRSPLRTCRGNRLALGIGAVPSLLPGERLTVSSESTRS